MNRPYRRYTIHHQPLPKDDGESVRINGRPIHADFRNGVATVWFEVGIYGGEVVEEPQTITAFYTGSSYSSHHDHFATLVFPSGFVLHYFAS